MTAFLGGTRSNAAKKYYSCRYIFIVTIKHFFIYVYMESRLPQVNT